MIKPFKCAKYLIFYVSCSEETHTLPVYHMTEYLLVVILNLLFLFEVPLEETVNNLFLLFSQFHTLLSRYLLPLCAPFAACRILVPSDIPCTDTLWFLWTVVLPPLGHFTVPLYLL